jgi:nucleoside-diphosphate-sugar epimerase
MQNHTIVVTGGSGFIGTNLIEFLAFNGYNVVNLDKNPPRCSNHLKMWRQVDILNQLDLFKIISEISPDYVIHLAARTDLNGFYIEDYEENTMGVKNLISVLKNTKSVKRVLFISSMLVCNLNKNPISDTDYSADTVYGKSKVIGEKLVREEVNDAFEWIIVRPTSIWGPWFEAPYRNFFDAIKFGYYFHPNNLMTIRSYGFVLNSVFQLEMLLTTSCADVIGGVIYLSDYDPINIKEWAEMIDMNFNGNGKIKVIPKFLLKIIAKCGDLVKKAGYKNPPLCSRRLQNMSTSRVFDLSVWERICPRLPYTTQEGVQITCNWMESNCRTASQ